MYKPETIKRIADSIEEGSLVTDEQENILKYFGLSQTEYEGKAFYVKRRLYSLAEKYQKSKTNVAGGGTWPKRSYKRRVPSS